MSDDVSESALLKVRLIDRGFAALCLLIKCGTLVAIAYCAVQAIEALAGEKTDATISIALTFLTKTTGGSAAAMGIGTGILGVAYGLIERRLRYQKVEHLQGRVKELEVFLDPNRSSSGLTIQGRTNPRDI